MSTGMEKFIINEVWPILKAQLTIIAAALVSVSICSFVKMVKE